MNVMIQKESELADIDMDIDENDDKPAQSVDEQRKQNLESIETLEYNNKELDKADLNNHKVRALEPKKFEAASDPEPKDEGPKWFDKSNLQTKSQGVSGSATIRRAPWTVTATVSRDAVITAPAGASAVSAAAAPIDDSPVFACPEPVETIPNPHEHIYDNFPKGKLCKDGCPDQTAEAPSAPSYSSQLADGTSSQESTKGRSFLRNESLTGDPQDIGKMTDQEKQTDQKLQQMEKQYEAQPRKN